MEVFIVEAIDPFSPKMGGGEVYSRNLMEYLASNGVGVTLLGVCHSNSSPPNNKLNFIPVARKARLTGYEYFLRLMAKIPFTRIPASTIIHVQRPEYMLPFILFHWKNPKMVTLHGRILEGVKLKKSKIIRLIYQMVESFALQHSDMIIAVDEATREFYKRQYPQITAKINVIPIGIDLSKFRLMDRNSLRRKHDFKPNDKVIAYVGRLEKEKSIDFLIDCFALLVKLLHEAILVLVGDGRDRAHLEGLVRSLGLERVVFMGAQEPDKVPEILNCADVLALCSLFEGSPTVVKEALACGSPVVSTDIGDVHKIIRNEAIGRIVNRKKEDFTNTLADMLLTEDRARVRFECAKAAADFGFEQVGASTVELYLKLLRTKGWGYGYGV